MDNLEADSPSWYTDAVMLHVAAKLEGQIAACHEIVGAYELAISHYEEQIKYLLRTKDVHDIPSIREHIDELQLKIQHQRKLYKLKRVIDAYVRQQEDLLHTWLNSLGDTETEQRYLDIYELSNNLTQRDIENISAIYEDEQLQEE